MSSRPPQQKPETTKNEKGPSSEGAKASSTAAYVDSVEAGVARVLLQGSDGDWHSHSLPALLLPKGAGEGSWLTLSVRESAAPEGMDSTELRKVLGRSDSGGDLRL